MWSTRTGALTRSPRCLTNGHKRNPIASIVHTRLSCAQRYYATEPLANDAKHFANISNSVFRSLSVFEPRHIGPRKKDVSEMLNTLGYDSLDAFIDKVVPPSIRIKEDTISDASMPPLSESEMMNRAQQVANQNEMYKNFIGMGYSNAVVPSVVLRNLTENPAWYTSYTPYQPEISQGRLESLINFQTVCTSLTGLDISNASLLDEATAAAEAMTMCYAASKQKRKTFLVDRSVLPQTLAVLQTRAGPLGINLIRDKLEKCLFDGSREDVYNDLMGVIVQYPSTRGNVYDWHDIAARVHELGGLVVCATDLLALTMIKPPGEWGADIAVGNSARFGVPLGYGGPHAAFFSCRDEHKRKMPGRLVGLSKDVDGGPAYRLALQTREQHIRRDKATSNVCTAQALLANMAANYAVYHGPDGLRRIAYKVHSLATVLRAGIEKMGYEIANDSHFDTVSVLLGGLASDLVLREAEKMRVNLRRIHESSVGMSLDESTTLEDIVTLLNIFQASSGSSSNRKRANKKYDSDSVLALAKQLGFESAFDAELQTLKQVETRFIPDHLKRMTDFMTQPVFHQHKSETEMMRYLFKLQSKDLSLVHAIIPLGSCTMKLNSASSMIPLTWPEFGSLHPFAPLKQAQGYQTIIKELCRDLAMITGLPKVSLQPNSGAQGEYTGLSVIRAYHLAQGQTQRDICLIPQSAHGTNPASAIATGMQVVAVKNQANGTLDLNDLRDKAKKYSDRLAAFMITYPSTYGVFEEGIQEACQIIHDHGGQVYLDGANMNAQLGITNPGACGADVCHLNLHKTFGIPHGGGGPGVGPICVADHLGPYLPDHPIISRKDSEAIPAVAAAPFGSASILTISWIYCRMLGGSGLTYSSKIALLNANYMLHRLKEHYDVKYKNSNGYCAHEFIVDLASFDKKAGIKVTDVAKRLQDYSIHPPTCAWPVSTAMLIEPTECESKEEIDRFCDAMVSIRAEIEDIITSGKSREDNLLKNAPHTVHRVTADVWDRPYSRSQAAFPDARLKDRKFWPAVGRVQESYGDLNLMCECPSVDEVAME